MQDEWWPGSGIDGVLFGWLPMTELANPRALEILTLLGVRHGLTGCQNDLSGTALAAVTRSWDDFLPDVFAKRFDLSISSINGGDLTLFMRPEEMVASNDPKCIDAVFVCR